MVADVYGGGHFIVYLFIPFPLIWRVHSKRTEISLMTDWDDDDLRTIYFLLVFGATKGPKLPSTAFKV